MPRGDGTGPAGQGPATGRGAGYCAGTDQPGYTTAGYGFGRGRARRNAWCQGGWGQAGWGPRGAGGYGQGTIAPGGGWLGQLIEVLSSFRREDGPEDTPQQAPPGGFQAQIDDLKRRIDEKLEDQ